MTGEDDLWLPLYAVLDRLEELDRRLPSYVSLPVLRRAAEAGALRSRGRRCDESGRAYGDTVDIVIPEWPALDFPPAPLFGPHPGTVQDRTAKHRTVYAEVELNGADLDQLWCSGAFQQPWRAAAAISKSPAPNPHLAQIIRHRRPSCLRTPHHHKLHRSASGDGLRGRATMSSPRCTKTGARGSRA